MLVLHAAFGIRARQGWGRFSRKPQSLFSFSPPAQQLESGSLSVLSHDLIPSLAAEEDAQGFSGLISHGFQSSGSHFH